MNRALFPDDHSHRVVESAIGRRGGLVVISAPAPVPQMASAIIDALAATESFRICVIRGSWVQPNDKVESVIEVEREDRPKAEVIRSLLRLAPDVIVVGDALSTDDGPQLDELLHFAVTFGHKVVICLRCERLLQAEKELAARGLNAPGMFTMIPRLIVQCDPSRGTPITSVALLHQVIQ